MRPGLVHRADLIALRTAVGWVISGCAPVADNLPHTKSCNTLQIDTVPQWHEELVNLVQRFWEIEEVPKAIRLSPCDEACERIFADHHRTPDGRYVVRLPVKPNASQLLGESLTSARATLTSVHRRMARDPEFAREYRSFMEEYLKIGHMRIVAHGGSESTSTLTHYIPHHGIWQKGDQGKKLRVVFNASRPTSTGHSLNDVLYTGPKLQSELFCVLVGWRRHRIAFCTDIKMMFRQIKIDDRDVDLQRILWSPSERDPIVHYQLLTVTYGEAPAPYLSLRALQQLCEDEGSTRPQAAQAVLKERYVDDILSGADDIESALRLRDQLIELLQAGGFPLRKWVSNVPELLQDLPAEFCLRPTWIRLSSDGPVNELGIAWDIKEDAFQLTPPIPLLKCLQRTKREILAVVASLFDPCGWLSPVIIVAKMLLQDLWRSHLDWDEEIPASMAYRWDTFKEDLPAIAEIRIPRWIRTGSSRQVQLHAFSDASRRVMAAVIYIRVTDDTRTTVHLIASKTKLNSIKSLKPADATLPRMTIPRLELRGVLLTSRLLLAVAAALEVSSEMCHLWCDAEIVLCWIQSLEPVGNTLIDNYISQIQELLRQVTLHHVPTAWNPADVATRGLDSRSLIKHPLWFTGPDWLTKPHSNWPKNDRCNSITIGKEISEAITCVIKAKNAYFDFFSLFSSLNVMLRFMVRLRRWIRLRFSRKPTLPVLDPITSSELNDAFKACVKLSQSRHFIHELRNIKAKRPASTEIRIRRLDLFICSDGLLRIGGRLRHSSLPFDERHPPLLSENCKLSTLVISWGHLRAVHGGFRLTYAFTMRRAWILGCVRKIRDYTHKCVTCARAKATPLQQKMASLPPERVTVPPKVFERTGVDYAGPFQVLAAKGRGIRTTKAYVAIFVCLNSKAVHIELVGDMTTDSFLGALTRFTGRRGIPAEIWSDNATTFRRADADLDRAFKESTISWVKIESEMAEKGITWRFIPPVAPHFGGLWEAGVKLVKTHLKRLCSPRNLTYEEFSTLLISIECVLNCRPLTPFTGDIDDLDALTAGHLLIGAPLNTIPDVDHPREKIDHLTHWELVRGLRDRFWDRWSLEYLNTLQQRQKWHLQRPNLQKGDLVIIIDATLMRPNGHWPLGRVIKTKCGRDGLVRSATIRTATGEYERPIVKLSKLPVSSENDPVPRSNNPSASN